jgi:hypothetical protein
MEHLCSNVFSSEIITAYMNFNDGYCSREYLDNLIRKEFGIHVNVDEMRHQLAEYASIPTKNRKTAIKYIIQTIEKIVSEDCSIKNLFQLLSKYISFGDEKYYLEKFKQELVDFFINYDSFFNDIVSAVLSELVEAKMWNSENYNIPLEKRYAYLHNYSLGEKKKKAIDYYDYESVIKDKYKTIANESIDSMIKQIICAQQQFVQKIIRIFDGFREIHEKMKLFDEKKKSFDELCHQISQLSLISKKLEEIYNRYPSIPPEEQQKIIIEVFEQHNIALTLITLCEKLKKQII